MIPDKIYVPAKWMHVPGNLFDTDPTTGATEYIRKDAILEWLEEELRNGGPTTLVQHVINRIKTL